MAPPILEVTVMAAEDLKDVAVFGKMDVYAVAWVDPYMKRTTKILRKGGRNPVWNESISLPLTYVRNCVNVYLTVQIFSESAMGDKVVGIGRLPMEVIYRISPSEEDDPAVVTLQLQRPSGRTQGIVSLSLRVTGDSLPTGLPGQSGNAMEKIDSKEPVMGIPVSPYSGGPYHPYGAGSTSTGYPSLVESRDASTGSEMVPYAYPPPYQGYYPGHGGSYLSRSPYPYLQPPQPQSRSNGSLLLGLLGGAIGGLILGDIIS